MSYDVSSPSNGRVKHLVNLRDRRYRDREQVFVVEEHRVLQRALASGHIPLELYWAPDLGPKPDGVDLEPVTMSVEAANRASYRSTSTGVFAVLQFFATGLANLKTPKGALILVAEGVEKPGNLGALLRIADGSGIDGVIVVGSETDVFNPNTVRASTGAVFTVPVAIVGAPSQAADWLAANSIRSVAATPTGDTSLWDADLSGAIAIWVGSEADGLSSDARAIADVAVAIPMAGVVDSLNVSVSAALLAYESLRQRRL